VDWNLTGGVLRKFRWSLMFKECMEFLHGWVYYRHFKKGFTHRIRSLVDWFIPYSFRSPLVFIFVFTTQHTEWGTMGKESLVVIQNCLFCTMSWIHILNYTRQDDKCLCSIEIITSLPYLISLKKMDWLKFLSVTFHITLRSIIFVKINITTRDYQVKLKLSTGC
jgi:hypothetical protein